MLRYPFCYLLALDFNHFEAVLDAANAAETRESLTRWLKSKRKRKKKKNIKKPPTDAE